MKRKKILISILIILILVLTVNFIIKDKNNIQEEKECVSDSDCVPKTCCHSSSCVSIEQAPDCTDTFCTMECRPNTMDCGAGSCACINDKCEVAWNE